MLSLTEIYESYQDHAGSVTFPSSPENLYGSIVYFLDYPGKRIRPVLCLMGNELFDKIHPNAYVAAYAMELFHNFTLVHDDIMDHSAIRRGRPTLHVKYGQDTAILAGDMLLIHAYLQLNKITQEYRTQIINIFSEMACQVCEGQQMDIEFEDRAIESVSYAEYLKMITLKTSVLLGAAAKIGAIIGSASAKQQEDIYEFGKNIGIAFQIQDDFLDAFGNTLKMGKQAGSDILENKKTALLLKAFELANSSQKNQLKEAMNTAGESKVQAVIAVYKELKVDLWADWAIHHYTEIAFNSLDRIEIPIHKKEKLTELANSLLVRQS
ncbi:polyprenyl synthetase family protein [Pedobacter steynii]|uniref:Polyprenyl synthetase n=1 Tax=Pedobacter steynii TaxID=430522 RepID=A0A1D7QJP0_9SPHI|nr:polyprenyl synthetase family protein [Pedobacter steynii]AOM78892.1 polyprenyl synthetase [Pedobacter steynii]